MSAKRVTQAIQCTCGTAFKSIPRVDIDPSGTFKYILIKVFQNVEDGCYEPRFFVIVRGYKRCQYHANIYDQVAPFLKPFDSVPFGGGLMKHNSTFKRISLYGYSETYGKANHKITRKVIQETKPYKGYSVSISSSER